jgi:hypothetical protein
MRLRDFQFDLPLFSPESAWNQRADGANPVQYSEHYVKTTRAVLGDRLMALNYAVFTFPIFGIKNPQSPAMGELEIQSYAATDPPAPPCTLPFYRYGSGGKGVRVRGIPEPDGPVRPSAGLDGWESDGAVILYNRISGEEYDFWQATTDNGGAGIVGSKIKQAGGVAWFQVHGPEAHGCQMPVCDARLAGSLPRGSCRATGIPYLAGLLLPEDFLTDAIHHALVFTLPRLRHTPFVEPDGPPDYYYPATRTETGKYTSDRFALAAGMRIRLKDKVYDSSGKQVDESALAPVAYRFLRALREYGAYLVDGGDAFGFATEDVWTGRLQLDAESVAKLVNGDADRMQAEVGSQKTTFWRILMEKLDGELAAAKIPFGSNFDVIDNAIIPDVNWLRKVTVQ